MITIEVYGIPRPGGDRRTFFNPKTEKVSNRPANKNTAPWRADVMSAAVSQFKGALLIDAVVMKYEFRFPRPKSHFGTGKNAQVLKPNAPSYHTVKPDLTKVIRSTEDALTSIVWRDDCLVADRSESKRYCDGDERPGVTITIFEGTDARA